MRTLRLRVYDAIMHSSLSFFDQCSTGDLVSRLTSDCSAIANDLSWVFRWSVESVVRVVGVSAYLMYVSWRLALVAYAIVPVIALVNRMYGNFLHSNSEKVQAAMASANSVAQECIAAARTVLAFSQQPYELKRYQQHVDTHYSLCMLQGALDGAYFAVISSLLMQTVLAGALLVYGVHLVLHGTISGDNLIAVTYFQGQLMSEFNSVLEVFLKLSKSSGSADKVFALIDSARYVSEPEDRSKPDRDMIIKEPTPHCNDARGEVAFDAVSFSYPTRPDALVLKNVSFRQPAGGFCAIVGPSGAGKTSCIQMLLGLYAPTSGRVLFDRNNVQDMDKRWLRQQIAYVGQEPTLFSGSIDLNIRYAELSEADVPGSTHTSNVDQRDPSNERVRKAAAIANADEFIRSLSDGYDTQVGERGVQLSGGQRQRIALARAIYARGARVLLLDEATSHLVRLLFHNVV